MIRRTEAERLAASIHHIRPDWPIPQLMTLIGECVSWPLRDLGVALAYVALDQDMLGEWVSRSPYRVKEHGPWLTVGIGSAEAEAARERSARELAQRRADIAARKQAVDQCAWCDDHGRLGGDVICHHDQPPQQRAETAATRATAARAAIRPTIRYEQEPA